MLIFYEQRCWYNVLPQANRKQSPCQNMKMDHLKSWVESMNSVMCTCIKYTSEKGWCPTKQSQLAWRENMSTFQPWTRSVFKKNYSPAVLQKQSLKCVDYLWYIAMLWSTITIRKSTFCIITLCFWTRWNIILFAINVTYYWKRT